MNHGRGRGVDRRQEYEAQHVDQSHFSVAGQWFASCEISVSRRTPLEPRRVATEHFSARLGTALEAAREARRPTQIYRQTEVMHPDRMLVYGPLAELVPGSREDDG